MQIIVFIRLGSLFLTMCQFHNSLEVEVHIIYTVYNYHYTNLTFVSVCVCNGRSPEAVRPRLKTFFFFAKLQLDATSGTPPTLSAKALAPG